MDSAETITDHIPAKLHQALVEGYTAAGHTDEEAGKLADLTWDLIWHNHHINLSWACLHGNHEYCNQQQRSAEQEHAPAQCRYCPSLCVCDCHV